MDDLKEATEKKLNDILELERSRSFLSRKITGGLAVVNALDFEPIMNHF